MIQIFDTCEVNKIHFVAINIQDSFFTHLHAVLEEVRLEVVDETGRGLPAVHHPGQAVLAVLRIEAFLHVHGVWNM